MNYKVLFDRVLIKPDSTETSINGIILHHGSQQPPTSGEVILMGNGRVTKNGTTIPMTIKVGDTVIFEKDTGVEVKLNDETYLIMKEDEILGILN